LKENLGKIMSNSLRKVPELSLLSYVQGDAQDQQKFVDQLFMGLKEYGFIVLVDHIIGQDLVTEAYDKVHEFFKLSTPAKNKYICPNGGGQRGYTAFGLEHAKDNSAADLKEFWHVGREVAKGHKYSDFYSDNIWPSEVADFEQTLTKLYNGLTQTSIVLLEALGKALEVDQSYFKNMVEIGNSILRPIHYPPIPAGVPANALRAAAHDDINLITILVGATDSGLELLDKDGSWLPVTTKPGQLIVDTGDMMKLLTNDVLPATTHRVVNPEDTSTTRYSMPFFVHPTPDTLLKCLPSCLGAGEKYEPINSHDFLVQRLHEIGLM
jgi:isopenicillin N synthase-like dioxygenase